MNYQILALDLDGTLTNSKKEIPPATAEALIDIQKKGKKVVLASGRPPQGILPLARQLRLDEFGSYILAFNGGRMIDCRSQQVIYNRLLPPGIETEVYELVRHYDADILGYNDGTDLLSGIKPNRYTEMEAAINHFTIRRTEHFPSAVKGENNKFLITGEPSVIKEIEIAAKKKFHSLLNIYCSELYFLEMMPTGIDKAHSLQRLLSSIGLSAEELICCGDGQNDISMIEYAGLGVAMKNAQPLVLERADYITGSNDEEGILNVIETFLK